MTSANDVVFVILTAAIVALALGMLFAFPIMFLWNYLMPDIFGLPTITFWQAFWLKVLTAFMVPSPIQVKQ